MALTDKIKRTISDHYSEQSLRLSELSENETGVGTTNRDSHTRRISAAFYKRTAMLSCIAFATIYSLSIERGIDLDGNSLLTIGATWITAIFFLIHLALSHDAKTIARIRVLIGSSMLIMLTVMSMSQTEAVWISSIATPAMLVAACLLFPKSLTIPLALLMIALLLSNLYVPSSAIGSGNASLVQSVTPIVLVSTVWAALLFLTFRRCHEAIVNTLEDEQEKTSDSNRTLKQMISALMLREEMQFKLQQTGKMSGWWFDTRSYIFYTGVIDMQGEHVVLPLKLNEDLSLSDNARYALQKIRNASNFEQCFEKILPNLRDSIDSLKPWETEFTVDSQADIPVCYRSIGELKYGKDGLDYIIGVLQDISSTKALTQRLEYQANFDHLTSLRNRRSLESILRQYIARARAEKTFYYYLFIDLDQFKSINDISGHVAGDALLQLIAKLIRKQAQASDVAGRVGGDEFALLLEGRSESEARDIAEAIRTDIANIHFNWGNTQHRVCGSIGLVCIDQHIESLDHLQLLADNACLEAKCTGGDQIRLVHSNSHSASKHRENSRWLQRLSEAINKDHFVLCEQEILAVNNSPQQGKSCEILIRLKDKQSGELIAPGHFLPIAERYNLCGRIDLWVVNKLIEILGEHGGSGQTASSYWVNLSGQSVGDKNFANQLFATIEAADLPAGTINFEITETSVIRDLDVAVLLIERLKSLGCQFALDDFGSGLASFAQLKKLPVDVIKIDGMFIREIQNGEMDRLFTKSIIELAHSLGIATVAEFVENDNIRRAVTELGVDYLQGFGIHRPEEISFEAAELEQKRRAQ